MHIPQTDYFGRKILARPKNPLRVPFCSSSFLDEIMSKLFAILIIMSNLEGLPLIWTQAYSAVVMASTKNIANHGIWQLSKPPNFLTKTIITIKKRINTFANLRRHFIVLQSTEPHDRMRKKAKSLQDRTLARFMLICKEDEQAHAVGIELNS